MPQALAFAGGFFTALTGGVVAFGAPTAAFAAGVALAGSAGSLIVTAGLVAGARLLKRSLSSQDTGGLNSPEVRGSIRQAIPFQRVVYGETRIGGALFYHNDSTPPYLVWGLLLSQRPLTEVVQTWIGAVPVQFANNGQIVTGPWNNGTDSRLRQSIRLGSPTQVIDDLLDDFDSSLPNTFRQRPAATATYQATFGDDADDFDEMWGLGTQIPNILLDVKGCPIYDPRAPTQDPADPTTWGYNNTASLVQTDVLMADYGGRQPHTKMRWDKIAEAADYDDEIVELADGTFQKRYTIDGMVDLSQTPDAIIESMMPANRGFVATDQGRLWVTSSKPETPVLTITDDMFRGGIIYRKTREKNSLLNTVRTRFVAPDREYQVVDGPIKDDAVLLAADGEPLETSLGLNFTLTHQRAQRLAELALRDSRLQKGIQTALTTRRSMSLQPGQVVRVDSARFPHMNGLYQIEALGYTDTYEARPVTLAEYDGTLAAQWTSADEDPFVFLEAA